MLRSILIMASILITMANKPPTPLAGRLTLARTLGGLTGRQLSDLASVADGLVSQVERGTIRSPKATVLGRIAQILGVSLDWLVLGVGEVPKKETIAAAITAAREAVSKKPRSPRKAKVAA